MGRRQPCRSVRHRPDSGGLPAGIDKALAAHSEPGKASVHFRADASGLLAVQQAEAVFETTEEYSVQVGLHQDGSREGH